MVKKRGYRRGLMWVFWIGILFTIGFTYYCMEREIPDKLSIVLEQEETLNLSLPVRVTLQSESEEVVLGNGSFRQIRLPYCRIRPSAFTENHRGVIR